MYYALCHEDGGIALSFLLGTRWRWVVNFRPWPLYFWRQRSQHPFDRRHGRPESRFGRYGEKKISCPCQEWNADCSAHRYSAWAIPTRIFQILYETQFTQTNMECAQECICISRHVLPHTRTIHWTSHAVLQIGYMYIHWDVGSHCGNTCMHLLHIPQLW
jgi:hypothetical protein